MPGSNFCTLLTPPRLSNFHKLQDSASPKLDEGEGLATHPGKKHDNATESTQQKTCQLKQRSPWQHREEREREQESACSQDATITLSLVKGLGES